MKVADEHQSRSTVRDDEPRANGHGPGVGPLLRASRLRCGEDLYEVARVLRIRYPYLEAIEEGRYRDLPGPTYAVGFIRAYADHLGLDGDEVVRRFKAETMAAEGQTELAFPTPISERSIPGGAVLFVGVVVALLAYAGWYVSTTKEGFVANLISPLPERLSALLSGAKSPETLEPRSRQGEQGGETEAQASPTEATAAQTTAAQTTADREPETGAPSGDGVKRSERAGAAPADITAAIVAKPGPGQAGTAETAVAEGGSTAPSVEPAPSVEDMKVQAAAEGPGSSAAEGEGVASTEAAVPAATGDVERAPSSPTVEARVSAPTATHPAERESVAAPPAEAAKAETSGPVTAGEAATAAVGETGSGVEEAPATTPPAAKPAQGSVPEMASSSPPPSATAAAPPQRSDRPLARAEEARAEVAKAPETKVPETKAPEMKAEVAKAPEAKVEVAKLPAVKVAERADVHKAKKRDESAGSAPEAQEIASSVVGELESPPEEAQTARVGGESGASRIVVRATANSWIQVRDDIGQRLLLTRLLRAGDVYRVPDRSGLKLLTGNAGALEILVDGKPVPPIGQRGTVRRGVALDADRLRAGTAVIE